MEVHTRGGRNVTFTLQNHLLASLSFLTHIRNADELDADNHYFNDSVKLGAHNVA